MITAEEIRDINSIYKQHGWKISRVLLSQDLSGALGNRSVSELFDDVEIVDSDFDAVWYSRVRPDGGIAWEIRHLAKSPFALCERFEATTPQPEVQRVRNEMEYRIRQMSSNK